MILLMITDLIFVYLDCMPSPSPLSVTLKAGTENLKIWNLTPQDKKNVAPTIGG